MINHSFNKQRQILGIVALDVVTVDQIIEYYISISKDNSLPRNLNILIDASKAKFQKGINKNEDEKVRLALKEALKVFDSICEAIIVDKPNETAISMLFREYNQNIKNFSFEIFSTQKAAIKWLLNQIPVANIG